ncbi:hypothetical protein [Nocardia bovistercoris]|uniref:Uncharacterized protein n=1 Tax=Nocardia bovistercoris TaxID=2785916 RepID=A0A931I7P3_9NOCA|nr:hypothetical protein [Nocardia bovistercoris]MBH0776457.1 hypothetical protein [Nocardia bovistercoris]
MDHIAVLFLLIVALVATAVVASYATVTAAYWFELRHARAVSRRDISR